MAEHVAIATDPKLKVQYMAAYDGGAWSLYRRWSGEESFALVGEIVEGPPGAAGLEVDMDVDNKLVFAYPTDSGVGVLTSTNQGEGWA